MTVGDAVLLGAEVGITRPRLASQRDPVAHPATLRIASPSAIVVPDIGLIAAQVGYRRRPDLIPPKWTYAALYMCCCEDGESAHAPGPAKAAQAVMQQQRWRMRPNSCEAREKMA